VRVIIIITDIIVNIINRLRQLDSLSCAQHLTNQHVITLHVWGSAFLIGMLVPCYILVCLTLTKLYTIFHIASS